MKPFSALVLFFSLACGAARAATVNFNYTLPAAARTSAGVYTAVSTPTLVRTLWSGKNQNAGLQTASWDGNKDDGTAAPAGTYTIKLLYNNVQYAWEGVIGNTSSVFVSTNANGIYLGLHWMADMAFSAHGADAFLAVGYNESRTGLYHFNVANPQAPDHPGSLLRACPCVTWGFAATDGTRVYFANTGGWDNDNNIFIQSLNVNGSAATFANGATVTMPQWNQKYFNVIDNYSEPNVGADLVFNSSYTSSGLAVQQSGNVLAVSHAGLNWIALFDKTSGAPLGTIAVPHPGRIAFAPNGDLWAITGASIERFDALTLGQTSIPASTIGGFDTPLAVGVDPNTGDVMVADGGSSQQVKRYASDGTPQWTLGQAGGYSAANGPAVANDKFQFTGQNLQSGRVPDDFPGSFIAVQPDGSFWVNDGGNLRVLHFDSSMNYLGKISYIEADYQIAVDPNNPARIFAEGYLEYQLDYTKTLQPGDPDPAFGGNGSWKLANNWKAGDPTFLSNGGHIYNVTTLSSGPTTMTIATYYSGPPFVNTIVQLPSNGPMVTLYGAANTPATGATYLASNGDLRVASRTAGVQTFSSKLFQGFTGPGGAPKWGASVVLATATTNNGDPIDTGGYGSPARPVITASNEIISFNGNTAGTTTYQDYHLGGVLVGGSAWQFKTSIAANIIHPDDQGTYPTQNSFGGHDGTGVYAVGHDVVWNYDGQYATFSNQYAHYRDDGLFIGQFGASTATGNTSLYGYSGNYGTWALAKGPDGNLYAFSGDESVHDGVHVWQISGLNSIQEVSAAATPGQGQTAVLTAQAALTVTTSSTVPSGSVLAFSAVLTSAINGAPLSGLPVTFTLNGSAQTIATDGSGTASGSMLALAPAGTFNLSASFAGNAYYSAANSVAPVLVSLAPSGPARPSGMQLR